MSMDFRKNRGAEGQFKKNALRATKKIKNGLTFKLLFQILNKKTGWINLKQHYKHNNQPRVKNEDEKIHKRPKKSRSRAA